ncbi:hypothetical protein HNY73_001497 [Argiope bruennichi]|uniref:Uncharacterized protein n=1 Tax=Argiope bruennichi TaxID=94029 RepID=A0A8T0G1H0_ARGBR|nr:hypothetical protein HNY73_001497 [Argiope bruennichi]
MDLLEVRLFPLEISQSEKSAIPSLPKSDFPSTTMIPDGTPNSSYSHAVPDVRQPTRSRYGRLLKPNVLMDHWVLVSKVLYETQRWESVGNQALTVTSFNCKELSLLTTRVLLTSSRFGGNQRTRLILF